MGLWNVDLNQVSMVQTRVLRVISHGFLTSTHAFSNRRPTPFPKAHALSYRQSKVGNDPIYIHGELISTNWPLSKFQRDQQGPKGESQIGFCPLPMQF